MAGYRRKTALTPAEVIAHAEADLEARVGLTSGDRSGHTHSFSGKEGTVALSVHRHGPYSVVTATTDGLRTSRIDYEIQRFLNTLPYEPGDVGGPGSGESS
jgi:hypothetical protein